MKKIKFLQVFLKSRFEINKVFEREMIIILIYIIKILNLLFLHKRLKITIK